MSPHNILHVFRAPVGGLFRHVLDLARAQAERGHRVGLICDSQTGGARAEEVLAALEPALALGLTRYPMHRQPHPSDIFTLRHVMGRVAAAKADIVHGHGAKGGAYSRLIFNRPQAVRAYIPHGGSLLFTHDTLAGKVYLATERFLMRRGDLFLFESGYSADMFRRKIGVPAGLVRIVHNGVPPSEFEPVTPEPDATDLVFIGEMRMLKGVDILIDAIAQLRRDGRAVTATLVGNGPDRDQFAAQVERLSLGDIVRFKPATPQRQAQAFGRVMVVPSRLDSFPYIVLEATASGKPLIASDTGGIPEIFGPFADRLVAKENVSALAQAIARALDGPQGAADFAQAMRARVAEHFSIASMVDGVLGAYAEALRNLERSNRR
jgi:glycosyltransferase involved in cell wall biosynthesis